MIDVNDKVCHCALSVRRIRVKINTVQLCETAAHAVECVCLFACLHLTAQPKYKNKIVEITKRVDLFIS